MRRDKYDEKNRRERGGVNKVRVYPCGICGRGFSSYGAQKRHLSVDHGKSTSGYDKMLRDQVERKG